MSSAALVRALALSLVGQPYSLGNEPFYDVGWEPSSVPLASDCSGLVYGVFRKASVLVAGKPLPRETADSYYRRSQPISQPTKTGDLGFLLRDGHAYHVFMYVGYGQVVEAGDGTGKVGLRTVTHENARGCEWRRLDNDIEEADMTPDEVRAIVREEVERVYTPEATEAQKLLVKEGLLSASRPKAHIASIGYVDLLAARLYQLLK